MSAGDGDRPVLRVVRGDATPEEVAALVTVLAAATGAAAGGGRPAATSAWNDRTAGARRPFPHGPGVWRASAWPR
ncbi:MAG: acyl-CoA carboxylase epsilon subunit [Actinomycetota bacterium]